MPPAFNELKISDSIATDSEEIQILIWSDYYWDLVEDATLRSIDIVASKSYLGWILSDRQSNSCSATTVNLIQTVSDASLKSFFDLESLGILPNETEAEGLDPIHNQCKDIIKFSENRYEVTLPVRGDIIELQNNR